MADTTLSRDQVLYNILEYLQSLKSAGLNEDSVESLDVATQCLSSAFSLDLTDEATRTRLSLGQPQDLPQLLAMGSSNREKLAEALETLKKKQQELNNRLPDPNDIETKFGAYMQTVKSKGLFNGVTPGSAEYESRFLRAREKFIEKYFPSAKPQNTTTSAAAPTAAAPVKTEATREVPVQSAPVKKEPTTSDLEAAEKLKGEGNAALQKKDYPLAIEKYNQAINLNPNNAIYYSNRAAAHSQSGDHDAALRDGISATSVDPNYSKGWGRMGLANFQLGKYTEAVSNYTRALELEPSSESFKSSLEAAQKRLSETAPQGAGGMDIGGMLNNPEVMDRMGSMFGGADGISSMLNNPMFQNMAQQLMNNPQMVNMANNLMQNPEALGNIMNQFGMASQPGQRP